MHHRFAPAIFALSTLLALGACSTTNHDRTVELAGQFTSVAADIDALRQQVDTALQGLDALTQNGDAAGAYADIASAAANIGPATAALRTEIQSTQTAGKDHFASWSAQNVAIQDAELRGRATARQTELATLMDTTTTSVGAAIDLCAGFQQSLQDLQKYLANDLSPTAIGNAADLIARMRGEGRRISTTLASARQDAAHLGTKMTG
jgi:hypothetical protein